MYCRFCGREIEDDSKFCTYCGEVLIRKETKICPQCGSECDTDMIFCEQCGAKLEKGIE